MTGEIDELRQKYADRLTEAGWLDDARRLVATVKTADGMRSAVSALEMMMRDILPGRGWIVRPWWLKELGISPTWRTDATLPNRTPREPSETV